MLHASESESVVMDEMELNVQDIKIIYLLEAEVEPEFAGIDHSLSVSFSDTTLEVLEGMNRYRITAIHNGRIVGGSFNLRHPLLFQVTVPYAGIYTFAYVENLRRLQLRPEWSYDIVDLAENGPTITMDVRPVILDDRTLIPIRFIAYALEAEIFWDGDTQEVTLTLDDESLTFEIGTVMPGMDVPAQIIDGRTMVPLRFISEFFGATVSWNGITREIEIVK